MNLFPFFDVGNEVAMCVNAKKQEKCSFTKSHTFSYPGAIPCHLTIYFILGAMLYNMQMFSYHEIGTF